MRPILFSACVILGLIHVAHPQEKSDAQPLPAPFQATRFQEHVAFVSSDELAGRAVGSDGWNKAAEYVIQKLQASGIKPLPVDGTWFQQFRAPNGPKEAKNILGVVAGRGDLHQQAVIVTAHLDHLGISRDAKADEDGIFNGADDNASGVAALLLIAEALGNRNRDIAESQRTVIFALFDAEELGLLGAEYYVKHPLWPLDQTVAVINFDGMGRLRMGKVFASDAETNPQLAKVVVDAAKSRGLVAETRFGGHGRSDHAVFLDRQIPGMHFFTGANSDYHQVTDEWRRLNLEGGATISWLGWQALQTAMVHPERLKFEKLNPVFDMQFALNLVQKMGIIPAVNAQEGRYPQILFVLPGTPAAEFGVKSGDQIAGLNGMRFQRVEDALTMFQQLNFDDGIRLDMIRGGKEIEVRIPASFFQEMNGPKCRRLESGLYEVDFEYQPSTKEELVYLAGEFNDWKPTALKMNGPDAEGRFSTRLELKPGVYQYKFVHAGTTWMSDPKNLYQVGKYNNSVLWVGVERK